MGVLTPTQRAFLLAIGPRFVPDAVRLDAGDAVAFTRLIDEALAQRPVALQKQLGLLMGVMRWSPVLRYAHLLGHPKSYYCDHFVESDGFLLETCMYCPLDLTRQHA